MVEVGINEISVILENFNEFSDFSSNFQKMEIQIRKVILSQVFK